MARYDSVGLSAGGAESLTLRPSVVVCKHLQRRGYCEKCKWVLVPSLRVVQSRDYYEGAAGIYRSKRIPSRRGTADSRRPVSNKRGY